MANEEQLSILKQGVKAWNEWRDKNELIHIELSGADLRFMDLTGANLSRADLTRANLGLADLTRADLSRADLSQADLSGVKFIRANLSGAHLYRADLIAFYSEGFPFSTDLREADLRGADLREADLTRANLKESDLTEANLRGADLRRADLTGSNFSKAELNDTSFGNSDLSRAVGLEDVVHDGPSSIATDTFIHSKGRIPEVFLRGCGLSDWEIEEVKLHDPELSNEELNRTLYRIYDLRASQAIQITPLFVSYSHADSEFVDKVGNSLNKKGIRHWRDIHDMKAGRMEKQIDRAIRENPTVLLVLSEHSLSSDWVEHEVRTARGLEKEMSRDVLCPIALDDGWKSSRWPKRVMEQILEYNILDFSEWKDDSKFEGMFRRLIDGLELFYKG